jgi:hypothetical protein
VTLKKRPQEAVWLLSRRRAPALWMALVAVSISCALAGCSEQDATQPQGTTSDTTDATSTDDTQTNADSATSGDDSAGSDALAPVCGDGALDPDERCDVGIPQGQPGACPLTCDAGPGCTAQAPVGGGCSRHCESAPITACANGDGCCPSGCASASDSDCLDSCGNGVTDPGEACDGDCPSSCDATPPACASFRLSGDVSACNVRCDLIPLSICASGDGCCPSACDASTDSDCVTTNTCGDDIVQAGELCDGDCPTACPSPDMCQPQALVGDALTCDARCEPRAEITQCSDGDGCCPSGCDMDTDSDCHTPWTCAPTLRLLPGYDDIQTLSDAALREALNLRISGHTNLGYDLARDFMFNEIDVNANGQLECPYSGRLVTPDGTRTPGGFNTEHSWPRNDAAGDSTAASEPAEADLHHLYPTDATANNRRASFDFGWTDCGESGNSACAWTGGQSQLGPSRSSGAGTIFEVRPQYRGDMARAHFYFAVRYARPIPPIEEAVLREWHCQDPPDDTERTRNDRIQRRQGNRNPFVDRPDFVDLIPDF